MLGSVEAIVDGRALHFTRQQQRAILGILALCLNQPISVERLNRMLGHKPDRSHALVHTRLSELRAILAAAGAEDERVRVIRRPDGYILDAPARTVDASRFVAAVTGWRAAGSDAAARGILRDGLALWRGAPLAGIHLGDELPAIVSGLESMRLDALEDLFDLELKLGDRRDLLDEVVALADANPTRERLVAHKLRFLHRAGRTAEALRYFEQWRQELADELGVDPGAEISRAHLDIMRSNPAAKAGGFRAGVPRLLPHAPTAFAGRERQVAELAKAAAATSALVVVSGPAGVGKTALCLQVAHQLADQYPDGQLYVDLRGGTQSPLAPSDVLARFLRSLGVEGLGMPSGMEERVELYRDLVADRRVLVVLDNAADAKQVLDLIPGGECCGVIVNARSRLGGVLGAHTIDLDVLPTDEAWSLLAQSLGPDRLAADPDAAMDLARLCGNLPLALRIMAARLAAKPHWRVSTLVDLLQDERYRLDQFKHAHLDVRASIMVSYTALNPAAQRLLRLMGGTGLHEVTVWVAAALLGATDADAQALLEELFDAQLIDPVSVPGRFRLHDLIYLFAAERAETEDLPDALASARLRTYQAWLSAATVGYRQLYGGDWMNIVGRSTRPELSEEITTTIRADPLGWFDGERSAVIDAVSSAAADGHAGVVWELACTFSAFFEMRRLFDDWVALLQIAESSLDGGDDLLGQAAIQYRLGVAHIDRCDDDSARAAQAQAIDLFEHSSYRRGTGFVLFYQGTLDRHAGHVDDALVKYRRAVDVLERDVDVFALALAWRGLGQVHLDRGDLVAADHCLTRAMTIAADDTSASARAQILCWLSRLRIRQNRLHEAGAGFEEALAVCRAIGDRPGEVANLWGLGLVHHAKGEAAQARSMLTAALLVAAQPRPTLLETMLRESLAHLDHEA